MALKWYVVHAYSNFENKVKTSLEERIKMKGLQDKFGKIMVPTEEVVEMKEGQKRRSERKFFPGYVLVQMELDDETWHLVKEVPKVLGFIGGSSDKPAPITDKEADFILHRVEEGVDKPTLAQQAEVFQGRLVPLRTQVNNLNRVLGNPTAASPLMSNTSGQVNTLLNELGQLESSLQGSYAEIDNQTYQLTTRLNSILDIEPSR